MPLFNESNRKVLKFFAKFLTCIFFACGATFSGITAASAACTSNQIDVTGDGTNCQDVKFSLTTTDDIANGGVFKFQMGAIGTFYVDCGENGSLATATGVSGKTISRGNTTVVTYTCNYSVGGTKTLRFGGTATGYTSSTKVVSTIAFYISSGGTQDKILSVSGDLSAMFPKINSAATSGAEPRFYLTFYLASNLTSIPETLFSGYTTAVNYMFSSVFSGCNSVTSIPAGLFNRITGGGQVAFDVTFSGMKGLTSVPEGLFAGLTSTSSYMFNWTFNGCSNMRGYIPASTFAGLVGKTIGGNVFNTTFGSTQVLESCPADTTTLLQKFGSWVSCVPKAPVEITLDTTSADTGAIPSTIYLKHNTGWYSDAEGTTSISSLTTIPTKAGETFTGFYTGQNASGTKIIDENGDIISGNLTFTSIATTLYAHFGTPYTVTYSCGGESGTAPNSDTAFSGAPFTPAANTCSKTGHTFAGWAVSGTNDVKTAGTAFTWNYSENKTLTATWTPNTYTISYTMNGGTNYSGYPTSYTYGTGATINGTPTRTGYTFAGWCTNSGLTTCAMTQTISTTDTGNKTFYAKWTANQYTVTYSCGDGTGTKPADTTATYGSSFTPAANTCSKTEHTFAGWTVSGTSDVKTAGTGFTWNYTQNKTLTAKWTANTYNITLNNISEVPSEYTQLEYLESTGTQYILTDYVGNLHSRYEGAVYVPTTSDKYYIASRMTTGDTRNIALAGSSTSGFYDGYGVSSYSLTNQNIPLVISKKVSFVTDYHNMLKSITVDGVTSTKTINSNEITSSFVNTAPLQIFFNRVNGASSVASYAAPSGTRVYYLKIYENDVLVHNFIPAKRNSDNVLGMYDTVTNTFKTNAGSGTFTAGPVTNIRTYTYGTGTTIDFTTAGTRDGYTFAGWCTDSALTNCAMTQTIGTTATGDKTFYAKWTANASYTVTYACGTGATGNPPTSETVVGGTSFAPADNNTCAKTGYTFDGWNDGITDRAVGESFTWNYSENKTFTAKWTANTYNITLNNISEVPSEYTQLEYIESTGTQYIDTGKHFLFGDEFFFDYTPVASYSVENKGYGAGTSGATNITGGGREKSTGEVAMYVYSGHRLYSPTLYYSNTLGRHYTEHWTINTTTNTLNSTLTDIGSGATYTLSVSSMPTSFDSGTDIYLFRDHRTDSSSVAYPSKIRLYRTWLKRSNGSYAFNYIPAKRNSDNVIGLYDTVTNTFKTNAGSGTFAAGDPTVGSTTSTYTYGVGTTIDSTTAGTRDGYTFAGWCTDSGLTNCAMTQTIGTTTTGDKTFYAKWTAIGATEYDINYVMNGGTNYNNAPTTYMSGSGATIDGTPTKSGYTFAGWCTDSGLTSCNTTQTISASDTGDKTFYAKWTVNTYNITLNNISELPSEYTQLEYLQSTGTQYIDTGVAPTMQIKWVLDNEFTAYGTNGAVNYGTNVGNNGGYFRFDISLSSSGLSLNLGPYIVINSDASLFLNQRMVYTIDAPNMKYGYGNTEGVYSAEPGTPNYGRTILIFARHTASNGVESQHAQKTYSSKIYRNGDLIQNLIPAKRNSDNVLGMYDTVNNVFKTNAGSGTFTAGDPVSGANSMTYTYGVGTTIDATTAGTRDGYTFAGWCTDSALTNCAMTQTIGTTATGDKTFYAKWTAASATTYNVTYSCGADTGGSAPTDSTDYASGASVTTVSTANNTCTKTGNTFTGWSCGGSNVNAGSTFTISGDTTCTAQWSACTACAATNASCELSVVNNVCTYTTTCNSGYSNIQNNGAYNASCTATTYSCSAGTYLRGSDATCQACPAGYFCGGVSNVTNSGSDQGKTSCSTATSGLYTQSAASATSQDQCYRDCTTDDIAHSSAVTGIFYADLTNTCEVSTCSTGYSLTTPSATVTLPNSSTAPSSSQYRSHLYPNGGSNSNEDNDLIAGEWKDIWTTGDVQGTLKGISSCNSTSGDNNSFKCDNDSSNWLRSSDTFTNSANGSNCWCMPTSWTPSGGTEQSLSAAWVFRYDNLDASLCANGCADGCARSVAYNADFRSALFGVVGASGGSGGPATCEPNSITVNWGDGESESCSYGEELTVPATPPTRRGYTFVGWTFE